MASQPLPRPDRAPAQLPTNGADILALAARSLFEVLGRSSEGMLLVDRQGVVVWINDQYRRYLPALGFERESDFVGQPVSRVVQNTLMHRVLETGQPILIDLLTNRAGTFVVSRFPLRDEGGQVIGATDEVGLRAVEDRLHVHDLHATILWLMGLDAMQLVYPHQGRPERPTLNEGEPFRRIVGSA